MLRELEGTDWRWQSGSKHWQLRINDRLVAIWPRGGATETGRNTLGIITAIRRAKRGVQP